MNNDPNNFPREGQHSIVTRRAIDHLERTRPTLYVERHYTIGGDIETLVHSNDAAEREAAITNGERRLQTSSRALRTDFKHPDGDSRAAYIRNQKALSTQWRARQPQRAPSR